MTLLRHGFFSRGGSRGGRKNRERHGQVDLRGIIRVTACPAGAMITPGRFVSVVFEIDLRFVKIVVSLLR
jgi:hypothetical protein